jgi:hypothetical protein
MSHFKVYPSKRVKNHAAKKLRRIFDLKGMVILKHADSIMLDGDKCFGLHYCGVTKKDTHKHTIIIATDINNDMRSYIATLLHEYVHAWQFENGYPLGHGRNSKFKQWAKYLFNTQKGVKI